MESRKKVLQNTVVRASGLSCFNQMQTEKLSRGGFLNTSISQVGNYSNQRTGCQNENVSWLLERLRIGLGCKLVIYMRQMIRIAMFRVS